MAGQRVGYVRGSSLDQNTQRQPEGVQLDRIFTDEASDNDAKRVTRARSAGYRSTVIDPLPGALQATSSDRLG